MLKQNVTQTAAQTAWKISGDAYCSRSGQQLSDSNTLVSTPIKQHHKSSHLEGVKSCISAAYKGSAWYFRAIKVTQNRLNMNRYYNCVFLWLKKALLPAGNGFVPVGRWSRSLGVLCPQVILWSPQTKLLGRLSTKRHLQ